MSSNGIEFIECRLDDIAEMHNHKRRPLNSRERENMQGQYPYYGASGIFDYLNDYIFDGEYVLISEDGENLKSRKTPIAFKVDGKFWVNNHAHIVKGKEDLINEFIVYYFANLDLNPFVTGAVQPKLNKENLLSIPIFMPKKPEIRNQFVSVLKSIDDKIGNNLATNQTLEEIARTLFKEWFVNFNYPGSDGNLKQSEFGEIPVSWEVGTLGDVLEIKYGKDHKNLEEGIIPVYGSGGIMRYVNKPLYEKESILIPRKGTLSNLFYVNTPFWSVDTMFYTRINLPKSGKYLFHLLQTLNLASMNVGTAVPSLTTEILNNIIIPIPPNEVLNTFETFTTSLFDKVQDNLEENKILSAIRDSLLPQLMSGKIKL